MVWNLLFVWMLLLMLFITSVAAQTDTVEVEIDPQDSSIWTNTLGALSNAAATVSKTVSTTSECISGTDDIFTGAASSTSEYVSAVPKSLSDGARHMWGKMYNTTAYVGHGTSFGFWKGVNGVSYGTSAAASVIVDAADATSNAIMESGIKSMLGAVENLSWVKTIFGEKISQSMEIVSFFMHLIPQLLNGLFYYYIMWIFFTKGFSVAITLLIMKEVVFVYRERCVGVLLSLQVLVGWTQSFIQAVVVSSARQPPLAAFTVIICVTIVHIVLERAKAALSTAMKSMGARSTSILRYCLTRILGKCMGEQVAKALLPAATEPGTETGALTGATMGGTDRCKLFDLQDLKGIESRLQKDAEDKQDALLARLERAVVAIERIVGQNKGTSPGAQSQVQAEDSNIKTTQTIADYRRKDS